MSLQDQDPTFTQLPPGLDPNNLGRQAREAAQHAALVQQAQAKEAPPEPAPQPQPQQEAEADQSNADQTTDASPLPPGPTTADAVAEQPGMPEQMRKRWAPYQPLQPRQMGQLGQPWWPILAMASNPSIVLSPFMPTPYESYGVMRDAGYRQSQMGSPLYGVPYGQMSAGAGQIGSLLDSITGGRFTKGMNRARLETLKIQQEEMFLNAQRGLEEHERMLTAFDEVFNDYQHGGISDEQAREKVRGLAMEFHHDNLQNVLKTGDLAAVKDWLLQEDKDYRHIMSGYSSLRNATGADKNEASREYWEEGGGKAGFQPKPLPGKLADTEGVTPATVPESVQTPAVENSMDAGLSKKYNLGKNSLDAAHLGLNDEEMPGLKGAPSDIQQKVGAAQREMQSAIDRIANDPNMSAADKVKKISGIDSNTGNILDRILNYDIDPKQPNAPKNHRHLIDLAGSVDRNYKTANFEQMKAFGDPKGPLRRELLRVNGTANGAVLVLDELNKLTDKHGVNVSIPKHIFERLWAEQWDGDPEFNGLFHALRDYAQESVAVASGTGVVRPSLVDKLLQSTKTTASPSQIREGVIVDVGFPYSAARQFQRDYQELSKRPGDAPGINPNTMQTFDALVRMNTMTGKMPKDAPIWLQSLSRDEKPGFMKKGRDDWEPKTRKEFDEKMAIYNAIKEGDPEWERRNDFLKGLKPHPSLMYGPYPTPTSAWPGGGQ